MQCVCLTAIADCIHVVAWLTEMRTTTRCYLHFQRRASPHWWRTRWLDWLTDSDWLASDASIMTHSVVVIITMAIPRCAVVCRCGGFYKNSCLSPACLDRLRHDDHRLLTNSHPTMTQLYTRSSRYDPCEYVYVRVFVMRQAHRL